jgi:carrier protein
MIICLFQLGYEPFKPVETTNLFFRSRYLGLPNVFNYCKSRVFGETPVHLSFRFLSSLLMLIYLCLYITVKYLKSVDGITGCYRGIVPRLVESNLYYLVYNKVAELFPPRTDEEEEDDGKVAARRRSGRRPRVVCISVGTTVSHPFHVLGVRAMAQFVGREVKYEYVLFVIDYFDHNHNLRKAIILCRISDCSFRIQIS